MIIYASENLDEFTFNRIREIAAGFNITLLRGNFGDGISFREHPMTRTEDLKSLRVIDECHTIKKSIERLKLINQI